MEIRERITKAGKLLKSIPMKEGLDYFDLKDVLGEYEASYVARLTRNGKQYDAWFLHEKNADGYTGKQIKDKAVYEEVLRKLKEKFPNEDIQMTSRQYKYAPEIVECMILLPLGTDKFYNLKIGDRIKLEGVKDLGTVEEYDETTELYSIILDNGSHVDLSIDDEFEVISSTNESLEDDLKDYKNLAPEVEAEKLAKEIENKKEDKPKMANAHKKTWKEIKGKIELDKTENKVMKQVGESLNEDSKFDYQLLDRLKQDCLYFIEHPTVKHLWAHGIDEQIAKMKELYNKVPEKPEWLSLEDINDLEKQMKAAYTDDMKNYDKTNGVIENLSIVGKLNKVINEISDETAYNAKINMIDRERNAQQDYFTAEGDLKRKKGRKSQADLQKVADAKSDYEKVANRANRFYKTYNQRAEKEDAKLTDELHKILSDKYYITDDGRRLHNTEVKYGLVYLDGGRNEMKHFIKVLDSVKGDINLNDDNIEEIGNMFSMLGSLFAYSYASNSDTDSILADKYIKDYKLPLNVKKKIIDFYKTIIDNVSYNTGTDIEGVNYNSLNLKKAESFSYIGRLNNALNEISDETVRSLLDKRKANSRKAHDDFRHADNAATAEKNTVFNKYIGRPDKRAEQDKELEKINKKYEPVLSDLVDKSIEADTKLDNAKELRDKRMARKQENFSVAGRLNRAIKETSDEKLHNAMGKAIDKVCTAQRLGNKEDEEKAQKQLNGLASQRDKRRKRLEKNESEEKREVLQIKFVGVDEWNRPAFKPVDKSKKYYLTDVNNLFNEDATEEEIKKFYADKKPLREYITYHGRSLDDDPMGSPLKFDLEIV